MRIIDDKDNFEERFTTCDNCGCEIGYTKDDVIANNYNETIECPNCFKDIVVKTFDRPFKFPDSYYHFNKDNRTIEHTNDDIEKQVKYCVKHCLEENIEYCYWASGNIMVIALKEDDGIGVYVIDDYYVNYLSNEEARELINAKPTSDNDNSTMKLFFLEEDTFLKEDKKIFLGEFSTKNDIWKRIYGYCEEKGITIPYVRLWNENDAIKIDYGSWSNFFIVEGNIEDF